MIQYVQNGGRRIRIRASQRLRAHFLGLARRLLDWQRSEQLPGTLSIGVLPAESRVGNSTVALNLAAALTSICSGNVLLVECNVGKPGLRRRLPRPGFGLAEVLKTTAAVGGCIHPTSLERLFFMGPGRVESSTAMELPFEAIASLNADVGESFDYLIYDLPVASEVSPCYPIVQHLDAAIIVAEANRIDQERIRRVTKRLEELQTPLLGMVLNKA